MQKNLETFTQDCYDAIALFLCVHLIMRYQLMCHKRAVPALDQYWKTLQAVIWPRYVFNVTENKHISNLWSIMNFVLSNIIAYWLAIQLYIQKALTQYELRFFMVFLGPPAASTSFIVILLSFDSILHNQRTNRLRWCQMRSIEYCAKSVIFHHHESV